MPEHLNRGSDDLGDGHPRFLISDLCHFLEQYLEKSQVQEVYRAYLFGAEAHEGQHRVSGEPYIYHPLAVARILAEMRMDHLGIIAAILHDVIEDTSTVKDEIRSEFGDEVAELVDGVSKLELLDSQTKAEAQAESFRKMLMAMAKDLRVILIKLADRLHNMRTLGVMSREKRQRIASETLDIYAPIANRLGMNSMRLEFEDLCFAACYPMRCRVIKEAVQKRRGNRKKIIEEIQDSIRRRMQQEDLKGDVFGRQKHLLSIYNKMRSKHLPFSEVSDVYAFRIIVDSVDTCYRMLGLIHNLFKPVPGRFKDYIAIPKVNGYQSLHSILFGPHGVAIEVQIRTNDMDQWAESGIAAHWLYKSDEKKASAAQARAHKWLHGLLEMQKDAGDSLEFIESVKIDLFPDEVYVFTPNGEIKELPRGATAVDFAYSVHTDIGNRCVAVRIDKRLAPLKTRLYNGQTIEIVTAPGARPNPSWLNFALTAKARSSIRSFLKNSRYHEAVAFGRRLLDKSLARRGLELEQISSHQVDELIASLEVGSMDDVLEDIGLGNRMAELVARRLSPGDEGMEVLEPDDAPLLIRGTEGMVVHMARCCHPIPGDIVLGVFSAGRGVIVHCSDCSNVSADTRSGADWMEVEWDSNVTGDFSTDIRVDVVSQRGALATIAAVISESDSNVENVIVDDRDGMAAEFVFTVTVRDREHLDKVVGRVKHIQNVLRVSRAQ